MQFKVGDQVRIIDPTRVVAFQRHPSLWTGGTYTVSDTDRPSYRRADGIIAIRPNDGRGVSFAVSTDNLERVR